MEDLKKKKKKTTMEDQVQLQQKWRSKAAEKWAFFYLLSVEYVYVCMFQLPTVVVEDTKGSLVLVRFLLPSSFQPFSLSILLLSRCPSKGF